MRRNLPTVIVVAILVAAVAITVSISGGPKPSVADATTSTTAAVYNDCLSHVHGAAYTTTADDATITVDRAVCNLVDLFAKQGVNAQVVTASKDSQATPAEILRTLHQPSWPMPDMMVFAANLDRGTADVFVGQNWQAKFKDDPEGYPRIWKEEDQTFFGRMSETLVFIEEPVSEATSTTIP